MKTADDIARARRRQSLARLTWRLYFDPRDREGRLKRVCRCDYCSPGYRRPGPGMISASYCGSPESADHRLRDW